MGAALSADRRRSRMPGWKICGGAGARECAPTETDLNGKPAGLLRVDGATSPPDPQRLWKRGRRGAVRWGIALDPERFSAPCKLFFRALREKLPARGASRGRVQLTNSPTHRRSDPPPHAPPILVVVVR